MARDGYATIMRTLDPAQGELVAEMLRREGIEARFHRVSSTLIGLPETLVEMDVAVPAEDEARAREMLAELEYVGAAEEADQPAEDPDDASDAVRPAPKAPPPRRHPFLAAGFAVFLPGGAHLYARRPWTTLVIALGELNALALVLTAGEALLSEIAVATFIALVVCDAFAGVRAARATRRGEDASRGVQLARGLGLMLVAVILGLGLRAAAEVPRRVRAWRLARATAAYHVGCTVRSIIVENHSGEPREIEIGKLEVVTSYLYGRDAHNAEIVGPRFLTVAPGARVAVTVMVPEAVAGTCRFPSVPAAQGPRAISTGYAPALDMSELVDRPMGCHFEFAFAARKLDGVDDDPFETSGSCNPSSKTNGEIPDTLQTPR